MTAEPAREADPPGRTESARGFAFAATLILTLLAGTVLPQLPGYLVSNRLRGQRAAAAVIWPQEWSFFADPASGDVLFAFRLGDGSGTPTSAVIPLMSAANRWGLSRIGDTQIIESHLLTDRIPADR